MDFCAWDQKNENILSAVLTIDGAWLNTIERKLFIPPAEVAEVFGKMPMDADFQWLDQA